MTDAPTDSSQDLLLLLFASLSAAFGILALVCAALHTTGLFQTGHVASRVFVAFGAAGLLMTGLAGVWERMSS